MKYKRFGNTGINISVLGFGAMRLPMRTFGDKEHVDMDLAVELMVKAFENGINYVDTGFGYCAGESEIAVGIALNSFKREGKVYVSTKLPLWSVKRKDDFKKIIEEQLSRLNLTCIDFYHFHCLNNNFYKNKLIKLGLIEEALKFKNQKLISHLSFSFHDTPPVMRKIIDTGFFSTLLCQYNLLDHANSASMAHAAAKGMGIVVMGPLAGGLLVGPSRAIKQIVAKRRNWTTAEMALRYVFANPSVHCTLSGINNIQELNENVKTATSNISLTDNETASLENKMANLRELSRRYCNGCKYCMPCPQNVNIPACFEALNYYKIYKLFDAAKHRYSQIGQPWLQGMKADACNNCGQCEPKCPQHISIRDQLNKTKKLLGEK